MHGCYFLPVKPCNVIQINIRYSQLKEHPELRVEKFLFLPCREQEVAPYMAQVIPAIYLPVAY